MSDIICKSCVMSGSAKFLELDSAGHCKYCRKAEKVLYQFTPDETTANNNLKSLYNFIKKKQRGKYDSIIGLSGGIDSSYVALLANKIGLNPICIHFDNSWNSSTAVSNIKTIINYCNFDLHTFVIDWPEFKDIQKAFFRAGVVDLEMVSDHAIFSTMYKFRNKYKTNQILSGTNFTSENGLPLEWIWYKNDWKNIQSIHKQYGTVKLKEFPRLPTWKWLISKKLGFGGKYHEILNLINYNKFHAVEELSSIGWKPYSDKHYESRITKFYQGYYLPTKFGIDKRKHHLSSLIRSKQMTRDSALEQLKEPILTEEEVQIEKAFFIKKLGITNDEFNYFMSQKPRSHLDFKSDRIFINLLVQLKRMVNKLVR